MICCVSHGCVQLLRFVCSVSCLFWWLSFGLFFICSSPFLLSCPLLRFVHYVVLIFPCLFLLLQLFLFPPFLCPSLTHLHYSYYYSFLLSFWFLSSSRSGCCVVCPCLGGLSHCFILVAPLGPSTHLKKKTLEIALLSFSLPVFSLRNFPFKHPCLCFFGGFVLSTKHVCFIILEYVFRVSGILDVFLIFCFLFG